MKWQLFPRSKVSSLEDARRIINSLSPEATLVTRLSGKIELAARPNTLSFFHGLKAFPFHTDQVLSTCPPKWLLLIAPRPRKAHTMLYDPEGAIAYFGEQHLNRALFVQRSRNGKYCRFLEKTQGRTLIHFNPDVMRAVNAEARSLEKYFRSIGKDSVTVDWRDQYMVLINNWTMLHARGPILSNDESSLIRISIWSHKDDMDNA